MRNLLIACAAAIALSACSSAAFATTVPTPTPALMQCSAQVDDSNGHRADFTINYANAAAVASASPEASEISLMPNSITLTPAHPSATVKISDPGYSGKFVVAFANCSGYINARFAERTSLQVSI
jgi:hypothetical protein